MQRAGTPSVRHSIWLNPPWQTAVDAGLPEGRDLHVRGSVAVVDDVAFVVSRDGFGYAIGGDG